MCHRVRFNGAHGKRTRLVPTIAPYRDLEISAVQNGDTNLVPRSGAQAHCLSLISHLDAHHLLTFPMRISRCFLRPSVSAARYCVCPMANPRIVLAESFPSAEHLRWIERFSLSTSFAQFWHNHLAFSADVLSSAVGVGSNEAAYRRRSNNVGNNSDVEGF
jgi:hypothetical protein